MYIYKKKHNLNSGSVRFDDRGRRSKFEMDILNVLEGPGIVKVGGSISMC